MCNRMTNCPFRTNHYVHAATRLACLILLCSTLASQGTTNYVSPSGTHTPPFGTWQDAATDIVSAVAFTQNGDTVLVTNGTYQLAIPIVLTNAITVRSVNGPTSTTVDGAFITNCFFVATNATVDGFLITRGVSGAGAGVYLHNNGLVRNCVIATNRSWSNPGNGGGVYCDSGGQVVDCLIASNTCVNRGGGIAFFNGGAASNCVIANNLSILDGGGVFLDNTGRISGSIVRSNFAFTVGGGISCRSGGTIERCTITQNRALSGGGVWCTFGGSLDTCLIAGNIASNAGGGVSVATSLPSGVPSVWNCTIVGNTAGTNAGGINNSNGGPVYNSIIYFNSAPTDPNYSVMMFDTPTFFSHCCATPLITNGSDNIVDDPQFADPFTGDFRIARLSPCVDAGTNGAAASRDLEGSPRQLDGNSDNNPVTDMGAYEFWGITISLSNNEAYLSWPSVTGRFYSLLASTTLQMNASVLASNIPGQAVVSTATDSIQNIGFYHAIAEP